MFASARLKIDRAKHHLRDLERGIARLPDLNAIEVQPDPQGRGNTIEHRISDLPEIMNEFALLIGDSVHNFRTALDHAWVESVKQVGLAPTDFTKFPMRETSQDLAAAMNGIGIRAASPALFDLMLSQVKPFKVGGDVFLWDLHRLDITDKHELILPVRTYASVNDIQIEDQRGEVITGGTYGGYFSSVIRIDIPATHKIKNPGNRSMEVHLGNDTFTRSLDVVDLLQTFSHRTAVVVQLLEQVATSGSAFATTRETRLPE